MKRSDALAKLKTCSDAVRDLGATSLYLFGSTARDEAHESSDVDVFIDYERGGKFSLLDLVDIKLLLEAGLGVAVDVTTRNSLDPLLRDDIVNSSVRVF